MAQSKHTGRTCALLAKSGLVAAFLASPGVADAESITNLGALIGGISTNATAVSADGSVVVGGGSFDGVARAWRWSRSDGVQFLPTLGGSHTTYPYSVSANGSVAVGFSGPRAVLWTTDGQIADLGLLPQHGYGGASGVSGDGAIVVGWSTPDNNSNNRSFRWTSSGGMQDLGTLPSNANPVSSASGISANGSVIVGYSSVYNGKERAFRWTQSGGMADLGVLPVPEAFSSYALAANADGSVVVGRCNFSVPGNGCCRVEAGFRWTDSGGMQDLGSLTTAGGSFAEAWGVSDDGSIVVGASGVWGQSTVPFLWHPSTGMVSLASHLLNRGVDLAGWTLYGGISVSGNGQFVVGAGFFNGLSTAFIADIGVIPPWESPCHPADLFFDHQVNGADLGILLSQWGPANGGTISDINHDGIVNGADLGYVLNAWGPCPN